MAERKRRSKAFSRSALTLPAAFADINIRKSWSVCYCSAAIRPLGRIMMHRLPVLLGLIVLALTTAGQENHAEALSIRLHRNTPLEERGREQLLRLLYTHDLQKWLFTPNILIQDGVIPHSHPVLTLNTRYLEDDTAQLATFVHEQLHWFLTDRVERAKTQAALTELRALYPTVPTKPPAGAGDERGTYLHLIVCTLELQAVTELLDEPRARQQLERWTHYTWVYRTVLTDTERLGGVLQRHGIVVPER